MEDNLKKKNLSAMKLICERGYLSLLKEYLPYYISHKKNESSYIQANFTLDLSKSYDNYDTSFTYSAAHLACDLEYVGILYHIHEFFQYRKVPLELDLHHIDQVTGENCALIAARTGNLALIKVLHEKIKADFHIKNKKKQGALHILAEASLLNLSKFYLPCVIYLVETVNVEVDYFYENLLLNLQDKQIIEYIENKLKEKGIVVTKAELEKLFKTGDLLTKDAETDEISKISKEISIIIPNISGNESEGTSFSGASILRNSLR